MKSFHRRTARPAPQPAAAVKAPPDRGGQVRIDALLVTRGLAPSRAAAQRLIDAGVVSVDGSPAFRASQTVAPDCCVAVSDAD